MVGAQTGVASRNIPSLALLDLHEAVRANRCLHRRACGAISSGCAATKRERRFTDFQFSDLDLLRYKEIAVKAAASPDVWLRFHAKRISPKSFTLSPRMLIIESTSIAPNLCAFSLRTAKAPECIHVMWV